LNKLYPTVFCCGDFLFNFFIMKKLITIILLSIIWILLTILIAYSIWISTQEYSIIETINSLLFNLQFIAMFFVLWLVLFLQEEIFKQSSQFFKSLLELIAWISKKLKLIWEWFLWIFYLLLIIWMSITILYLLIKLVKFLWYI
jgi:hypothetical protein